MKEEPSYKLGDIGLRYVNLGKVEYEGNLNTLFKNDINTFIDYNLRDVEIIEALEAKLKFIDLTIMISHICNIPYESVFDTTIRASANIIDTGFRNSKNTVSGMEVDDLHLTVGEKTIISVTDNKGTNLNIEMRVRAVGNVVEHTQYIGYTMEWYSKEAVENEFLDNRVVKRYEGKITDYVPKIFKECLKSQKPLKIDPCINTFNFLGHVQKPNYILTWLAKRTVPDIAPLGDLAGYFFWETTNGFNYRSIDKIFQEKAIVRTFIFNNTPYAPAGYEKILDYSWSENISMDKKLLTSPHSKYFKSTTVLVPITPVLPSNIVCLFLTLIKLL